MKCLPIHFRPVLITGLCLIFGLSFVGHARGDNPKSTGVLEFSTENEGEAIFTLEGIEERIGRYTAYCELDFVPGEDAGTMEGTGVVVLKAADGDLLVGLASFELDANAGTVGYHFSWRDSVTLRDCSVVSNTGRFTKHRPPGLIVIDGKIVESIVIKIIIIILR
jgi:hypothetical protein